MGLFSATTMAAGANAPPFEGRPRIVIHVYDHAHLPAGALAGAGREVSRILGKAGLDVRWWDRSNCGIPDRRTADCSEPVEATDLVLRIRARVDAPASVPSDAMGLALLPLEGGTGTQASVFLDDVYRLARDGRASLAQILGHAAAHEIGHLLLGPHAHSPRGIMRAVWAQKDLDSASRGGLTFTLEQGARIRDEAASRQRSRDMRHAQATEGPVVGGATSLSASSPP
jgi:hypothetical protein